MTSAEQELIDKHAARGLIDKCAARGVSIGEIDAGFIMLATRILKRDPHHALAKEVLQNFATHLRTGKNPKSFAGFMLSERDALPLASEQGPSELESFGLPEQTP